MREVSAEVIAGSIRGEYGIVDRHESHDGPTPSRYATLLQVQSEVFEFGRFRLEVPRRRLISNDAAIPLSGRAFDILALLVRRAGSVVGKAEILAAVWEDRYVEVSNLRVAMTGLRKALGDGQAGARFVQTVSGRGYCFVAPVARISASPTYWDEPNEPRKRSSGF